MAAMDAIVDDVVEARMATTEQRLGYIEARQVRAERLLMEVQLEARTAAKETAEALKKMNEALDKVLTAVAMLDPVLRADL